MPVERGVAGVREHHRLGSRPDAGGEGKQVRPAGDRHPRVVGVPVRRPEAGEVLEGRTDRLVVADRRRDQPGDAPRTAREGARVHERAGAAAVGHRGQVEVDAGGAQVARGRPGRGAGLRGRFDQVLVGGGGRPAQDPDRTALLVGRDQRVAARRALQRTRQPARPREARRVVVEQHDARRALAPQGVEDVRLRRIAHEAHHDDLPGEIARGHLLRGGAGSSDGGGGDDGDQPHGVQFDRIQLIA